MTLAPCCSCGTAAMHILLCHMAAQLHRYHLLAQKHVSMDALKTLCLGCSYRGGQYR